MRIGEIIGDRIPSIEEISKYRLPPYVEEPEEPFNDGYPYLQWEKEGD